MFRNSLLFHNILPIFTLSSMPVELVLAWNFGFKAEESEPALRVEFVKSTHALYVGETESQLGAAELCRLACSRKGVVCFPFARH